MDSHPVCARPHTARMRTCVRCTASFLARSTTHHSSLERPASPKAGRSFGCKYAPPVVKTRLDALLFARGLFESRSRAAAAVIAGSVRIGADGRRAAKPGQLVRDDVALEGDAPPPYV